MNIADHYKAGDMSNADMLAELLKVNKSTLGTQGKKQFEQITSSLYPTMCQKLFATATANYDVANYDTAISNLDQIMQMEKQCSFLHNAMKNRIRQTRLIHTIRRLSISTAEKKRLQQRKRH